MLRPIYADGISKPPIAASGGQLPSARAVSNVVFWENNKPDVEFTIANMQWGQNVAHDMSLLAGSIKSSNFLVWLFSVFLKMYLMYSPVARRRCRVQFEKT